MKSTKTNNINVVARFRPLIDIELELGDSNPLCCEFPNENSVQIHFQEDTEVFTFDRAFALESSQEEVYEFIGKPTINDVMNGYNGTIFAYGQTGSGKTHTMMGRDIYDLETCGIIPRAAMHIFEAVRSASEDSEFSLRCSMLEIYKETLKDLLGSRENLKIKEHPNKGIYVQGLTEECVTSEDEIMSVIIVGENNRTVASTRMNHQSSRSHQLFILEVTQKLPDLTEKRGILNLVDLAGSEKISTSGVTGLNVEETKKINLSLSALGNVIQALTGNSSHIPYRDSKLTRLLQESLGGNYKTSLIVNCSPHTRNAEVTLSTLKFAKRAKNIQNNVTLNIKKSPEAYIRIIEKLKQRLAQALNENKQLAGQISNKPNERKRRFTTYQHAPQRAVTFNRKTTFVDKLEMDARHEATVSIQAHKPGLQSQTSSIKTDRMSELEESVKELNKALTTERRKRLKAEHKALQYYEAFNNMKYMYNQARAPQQQENIELEALRRQRDALISYVERLTRGFSEQLTALKHNEPLPDWEFVSAPEDFRGLSESLQIINGAEVFHSIPSNQEVLSDYDAYLAALKQAIEDKTQVSPELLSFQLKKQLIQSGLVNAQLIYAYHSLHWRCSMLKEEVTLQKKLGELQNLQVTGLEETVTYLQNTHTRIMTLSEKLGDNSTKDNNGGHLNKPIKPGAVVQHRGTECSLSSQEPRSTFSRMHSFRQDPENDLHNKKLESLLHMQSLQLQNLTYSCDVLRSRKESLEVQLDRVRMELKDHFEDAKRDWQFYIDLFKSATDKELLRRQTEIEGLHSQLADWIHLYLEVQEAGTASASKPQTPHQLSQVDRLKVLTRSTEKSQGLLEQWQASSFNNKFKKPHSHNLSQVRGDSESFVHCEDSMLSSEFV